MVNIKIFIPGNKRNKVNGKRTFYSGPILLLLLLLFFTACNREDFDLGADFIEPKTNISLIDTFQVELSTVLLDSIPTSGDTTVLLGHFSDSIFGDLICNSAFEIGIPSGHDVEPEDVYDSICLILLPTDYYYGDTLSKYSFTVHRLNSDLDTYSDGYLYNTTKSSYDPDVLGSYSCIPRPIGTDTISIRLDDKLGLDLFTLYQNKEYFSSIDEFLEYFKGLILLADSASTNSILAFNASSLVISLHYHRYKEYVTKLQLDFPLANSDDQYNQIISNFSTSDHLGKIYSSPKKLVSEKSGDMSFMQLGTGLLPRIQFPTLNELLFYEQGALLKAELVFKPVKTSYVDFSLPDDVILYKSDKYNNVLDPIYNSNGSVLTGTLSLDEFYHENTSYTFDITQYINDQIDKKYFDPTSGLLVATSEGLSSNLERLVISAGAGTPKLKLYYVTYKE